MSFKVYAVFIKKLQKMKPAKTPTKQPIETVQVITISKGACCPFSKDRYPMLEENSNILEQEIETRPLF